MTVGRRLVLTRTGLSISLSLATLEAVGRMKLDAFRRIGAGEDGTATILLLERKRNDVGVEIYKMILCSM